MFRCSFLCKTITYYLLVNFLISFLFPTVSYALTSGPTQPEYTSYESVGSTDMVNLMTGDLTYSLPVVNIPSPDGGFSMNLSYHSGIGPEQEASWVGLGWSLNAGAIVRNVVQFPDDAKGNMSSSKDVVNFHTYFDGGYGWTKNYGVYHRNYDSEKGYGGMVDIAGLVKTSWNNDGVGFSVIGLGVNNKGSFTFEAVELMFGIATIASMGAGGALASVGKAGKALGTSMLVSSAFAAVSSLKRSGPSSVNYGAWKIDYPSSRGWKKNYRYYIDSWRTEEMYGILHLGDMLNSSSHHSYACWYNGNLAGTVNYCDRVRVVDNGVERYVNFFNADHPANKGIASDVMHTLESGVYAWQHTQTNLAPDIYSVMGSNVSGLIQPYRLDVGSVAVSQRMDLAHLKYNMFPFLDNYKVPFRYPLEYSNSYNYHYGSEANRVGIAYQIGTVHNTYEYIDGLKYLVSDNTINPANEANRKEVDRVGLKNGKLAGGKNIEWYSNNEILNNSNNIISSGKFIDYHESSVARQAFRSSRPQDGIGGFTITAADGMTYHYSLPVYTRENYNHAFELPGTARSEMYMSSPYAVAWLLTAITGPDFVDRGAIGVIDENDFGYWVKFNYGNFSNNYKWRPDYGKLTPAADKDNYYVTSGGAKELYYLDRIQTRTHVGLFVKNYRKDGKGYYGKLSDVNSGELPSSSLKLDEIIILTKSDYEKLENDYSVKVNGPGSTSMNQLITNGDDFAKVLDIGDITPAARNFMYSKQVRRLTFNYDKNKDGIDDYDLCKGTANSFYSTSSPPSDDVLINDPHTRDGKLTLHSISLFGKNNNKLFPDYEFNYLANNPYYGNYNWDGWGMYRSGGTVAKNTHSTVLSGDGLAWNLNKIKDPMGAEISIVYERDSYSSVAGEPITKILSLVPYGASEGGSYYLGRNSANDKDVFIFKFDISKSGPVSYYLSLDTEYYFSSGLILFNCGSTPTPNPITWPFKVLSILDESTVRVECLPIVLNGCTVTHISGKIKVERPELLGGDVRVKNLTVSGIGGQTYNNVGYVYTQDGTINSYSSGVVSEEPDFISLYDYPFYDYYDLPGTPVLYNRVTVYNRLGKTEYNFVTPEANMINYNKTEIYENKLGLFSYDDLEELKMYKHEFDINTAKVGKISSVKSYDKDNTLISQTQFSYKTPESNQGKFTEATFLTERVTTAGYRVTINRIFKTIKTFKPYILDKIITTAGEVSNEVKYNSYDFLTAQALETEYKNSLGIKYIHKLVPAYTKYAEMGSMTDNASNKNMLMQIAAEYEYKGSVNNNNVINASIQTWGKDDTYRAYDPVTAHKYIDVPLASNEKIWRKKANYIWNSAFLNPDGTYQSFVDFDWTGANIDKRWQKVNEVTHYNVFSQPLETKDINNDYASVQYDIANARLVASNTYGNMKSSTYSGFEYFEVEPDNTYHYEGEVLSSINKGTVPQSIRPHTGSGLLMLNPETTAEFITTTDGVDNSQLKTGIRYKASVWIHEESAANAELGVILNGRVQDYPGTTYTPYIQQWVVNAQESVFTSGKWRLLSLEFEVPSYYSSLGSGTSFNGLKIYLKGGTGNNTYFDDLRFHPVVSNMTNFVYNDEDQIAYQIDENNRYTRYEYDILGRISAIYRETPKGEAKLKEYKYNFGRQ